MARIPRYITRNRHGTLYFRVAVPRDLRPFFPSSEIQRSLHTNCLRQIATAAALLWLQVACLYQRIRPSFHVRAHAPKPAYHQRLCF